MLSGSTALTVAFVPTATKAGVLIAPCGVVITPERPRPFGSDAPGTKAKRPSTGCCGRIAERSGRTDSLPPKLDCGQRDDARGGGTQHPIADRHQSGSGSSQLAQLVGRNPTLRTDDDQYSTGRGKINFSNPFLGFLMQYESKIRACCSLRQLRSGYRL